MLNLTITSCIPLIYSKCVCVCVFESTDKSDTTHNHNMMNNIYGIFGVLSLFCAYFASLATKSLLNVYPSDAKWLSFNTLRIKIHQFCFHLFGFSARIILISAKWCCVFYIWINSHCNFCTFLQDWRNHRVLRL